MDLGDRGGGDRLLGELGEHGFERPTELVLDEAADLGEALRRHLIAQALELGHEIVGEQALERRDDLAELHVGGSEAFERPPQSP